jgi:hypothetical protein
MFPIERMKLKIIINKWIIPIRFQAMRRKRTKDVPTQQDTPTAKKGRWTRFLERLAKINVESPAAGCRH